MHGEFLMNLGEFIGEFLGELFGDVFVMFYVLFTTRKNSPSKSPKNSSWLFDAFFGTCLVSSYTVLRSMSYGA